MAKVEGVKAVIRNLRRAEKAVEKGVERGVVKAALFLLGESQKLVPIDTGNLRASGYVKKIGSGFVTDAEVGYTANYAVYVHENLDAQHETGQPKFLEQPARELMPQIIRIIAEEAKIK